MTKVVVLVNPGGLGGHFIGEREGSTQRQRSKKKQRDLLRGRRNDTWKRRRGAGGGNRYRSEWHSPYGPAKVLEVQDDALLICCS